ncbi:hypothetical protein [Kribbella sp. CA-293567]|uniref:hypothetical protein n=1 Tax=Kribbella sp. CA-293567 TaxID=3002436 RepID=UPI0022DE7722|nr:hypothetical protein [Kribbella sp. CA-293567]WBQ08442.1 hypothetical protein OX958_16880 [Kribbella sp. CA-293567]
MTAVRFEVETTFDLPGRGGILVPGRLLTGVIQGGTTLRIEDTDQPVRILGLEFPSSAGSTPATSKVTLVIERADAAPIVAGTVLISPV